MSPHDHQHEHSTRFYSTKTFRLSVMLLLTLSFFVVELVVGNITKSLALVADAFHMLSDVIALSIGLLVVRMIKRRTKKNTFGWVRAEVVGANINAVFLLALCLTIVFDTIKRYIEPEPIENPTLLLIVGSVGLGINLIGLVLFQGFHGHSHGNEDQPQIEIIAESSDLRRHSLRALDEVIVESTVQSQPQADEQKKKPKKKKSASMNMQGVFLHVLADALGSVVVIISSLIIKFVPHDPENKKHWTVYVDPTLSLLLVIIITISTVPLLKQTISVLLQTVPNNIQVNSLKQKLLEEVPEIEGIHDLHIWRLNSNAIIATAHLRRKSLTDYMTVATKVKKFFHSAGIHSTTIQYESEIDEQEKDCLLYCPDESCESQTCCSKDLIRTDGISKTTNNNQQQHVNIEIGHNHAHSNQGFTSEKF